MLRKQAEAREAPVPLPGTCREKAVRSDSRRTSSASGCPETGATTFHDLVKGDITTPHDTLQDEVILRGDGMPLYNFGALVDDITMKITLVARGDDHVNNTARQILMYEALGEPPPVFAHLPDDPRAPTRRGSPSATAPPASPPTATWASCPRRW